MFLKQLKKNSQILIPETGASYCAVPDSSLKHYGDGSQNEPIWPYWVPGY